MTTVSHSGDRPPAAPGQAGAAGPASAARAAGVARREAGSAASQQAGRARIPGWLRRPAVQGLLALIIYAAVWLSTGGRELATHIDRAGLDWRSMDPNFYTWAMAWWPYAVGHGLNPMFSHLVGAPAGHSLAWVTTVPPLALLVSPLTAVAGPVVSFNLLTVLGLPLAAWAAFVLCRRMTGSFWAAIFGGVIFGFSAYELNHDMAGQLNLTYSLLLPLLGYLVVVWWGGSISNRTLVILAGLLLAVQFYLFLETFADLSAIVLVSLVLALALGGRAARPRLWRLTGLVGLGYAGALALAAPYLVYALSIPSPKLIASTGLDLVSLITPRQHHTLGIAWLAHLAMTQTRTSEACYVGIPLLVLVILLAVTRWSSRLVRFLTVLLLVIIVAALGGAFHAGMNPLFALPWHRLFALPIVRNAYPLRLMLFAYLVLAVMTAIWLAGARRGSSGRPVWTASLSWRGWLSPASWPGPASWLAGARWLLGALAIAAIALDTPATPMSTVTLVPPFITTGHYQHQLHRNEIVVVVSKLGNAGMLWQAESGFYWRLAGGYVNQAITRRSDLPPPVQNLAHATPASVRAFESYVRAQHIGAILLDARAEPPWVGIFWRVGLKGHLMGNVVVYQTNGCRSCKALTSHDLYGQAGM